MAEEETERTEADTNPPNQPSDLLATIPDRVLAVILRPVEFFSSEMPKSGGYLEPLLFMVVMAVVSALVMAVVGMVGLGPVGMMAMGLMGIIVLPIMVAIFGFVGAAILFVIWKIMGSEEDFETAYRCAAFSYAYAPVAALVSGFPYIGTLISSLWPMALFAMASIHVHKRSVNASWAVLESWGFSCH